MCLHLKPLVISFDIVAFLDTITTYSDNGSTFYPISFFYAIIIYFQIVHGLHDGIKIKPFVD